MSLLQTTTDWYNISLYGCYGDARKYDVWLLWTKLKTPTYQKSLQDAKVVSLLWSEPPVQVCSEFLRCLLAIKRFSTLNLRCRRRLCILACPLASHLAWHASTRRMMVGYLRLYDDSLLFSGVTRGWRPPRRLCRVSPSLKILRSPARSVSRCVATHQASCPCVVRYESTFARLVQ